MQRAVIASRDFEQKMTVLKIQKTQAEQLVVVLQEQLLQAKIHLGETWAGELHRPEEADVDHGDSVDNGLLSQRTISGEVPLTSDGSVIGVIQLHECSPGSYECTSGGSLTVQDVNGETICRGELSLLSHSGSRYELNWTPKAPVKSENDKIILIERCAGETEVTSPEGLRRLLASLYEAGDHANPQSLEMRARLIRAILQKALLDRRTM